MHIFLTNYGFTLTLWVDTIRPLNFVEEHPPMSEKKSLHHIDMSHRNRSVSGQPETVIIHTDSEPGGVPAVAVRAVTVLAVESEAQPDQFAFRPDDN